MTDTEKMLSQLESAYSKNPSGFDALLPIRGRRGRILIAKTRTEVDTSGQSMNPKQISTNGPWVSANGSAPQLASFTFWIMSRIGYSDKELADFMRQFLSDVYTSGT